MREAALICRRSINGGQRSGTAAKVLRWQVVPDTGLSPFDVFASVAILKLVHHLLVLMAG